MKAGVIGLGNIGGGVAVLLARAGYLEAVYDKCPEVAEALPELPAISPDLPTVAQACDVIFIAVVNAKQVTDVLTGDRGILAHIKPGAAIVLLATVTLPEVQEFDGLVRSAGAVFIDAGVARGFRAIDKQIVLLVGAKDEELRRVRPVLDAMCKRVAHMGRPGTGMAAKIARNALVLGTWRAGYEGALLAKAAKLDMSEFIRMMDECEDAEYGSLMFERRDADPATDEQERQRRTFAANLIRKDLDAAMEMANEYGLSLPLVKLARDTVNDVVGLDGTESSP